MFKIGDVVTIRKDLHQGNEYNLYVSQYMTKYAGRTARIKRILPYKGLFYPLYIKLD